MTVAVLRQAAASAGRDWARLFPGCRPFGYFCSYWPEELVLALGWEPLRLLPSAGAGVPARLPAHSCFPARACLAAAGKYGFLAGVGFAHTCDTIQCLAGILPHRAAFTFAGPATPGAPGAEAYATAELDRLWRGLARLAGVPPDEEKLREAVRLMNRVRSLAGRLDEMRPRLPSGLTAALGRAGQVMPRGTYAAAMEAALPELAAMAEPDPGTPLRTASSPQTASRRSGGPGRTGLLLSGSLVEEDGLYDALEEMGARVVADDTCTGWRHWAEPVDEQAPPLTGLARRLSARPPCPCRHRQLAARPDYLLELARRRGARAAVLAVRKYCDPHAWDTVAVGERLRAAGIPVLVLEMETTDPGGPERTRLQAFLECLTDWD